MSSVSVSYGSLKDASGEAKAVARKLNDYANSIEKTVYNKLNRYSGSWTNSIYTARNNANTKMSSLRTQADRFTTYANNLIDLRDECKRVDKAVRSKVSSLTAAFKEAHGIRNSKIENAISYFFTSIGNSTGFGRWLGDKADMFRAGTNYLKESIKEWYNYDGGKDLIKGVLVGLLEVAIGILGIVGAILSGGVILLIAGVVAGVIAVANGIVNIVNEGRAYNATQNDDPATGKRLSAENTIQDFLRDGDITDEKNEGWFNNHVNLSRNIATGIDIVNICCTVITVVGSVGKLLKNGYKWATGVGSNTKNISFKTILSEGKFKEIFSGIKSNLGASFKEIGAALKTHDFSFICNAAKDFGSDFLNNLKGEFFDFSSLKDGFSSSKHILGVVKNLVKGDWTSKDVIKDIILPGITVFSVDKISYPESGQSFVELDNITSNDFFDIYDKIDTKVIKVIDKLSIPSTIDISIPEIYVPKINIPTIDVTPMAA